MNTRLTSVCLWLALSGCGTSTLNVDHGGVANAGSTSEAVTSGHCPNGPTVLGIDVSVYQGGVNWGAVKGSGVEFAIARVSDGTGSIDQTFPGNWSGMKAAGLIRGAYQYFEPGQDATAQANIVIARVGRLGDGDLPVMLDVEATGGQSRATITARIHTWVDAITAGTGKAPFIYTGAYFWDGSVASSDFTGLALDVAWYGTNCPGTPNAWGGAWTFHQYTSSASIPGVSGGVDADVFNGTLAQLQAFAGVTAVAPPAEIFELALGDYDGDGKTDRAIVNRDTSNWYVIASSGTSPIPWGWHWEGMSRQHDLALGDFDGDGKTDRAIVDRANGNWYVIASTGTSPIPWGWHWEGESSAHDLALGDYDGDGTTDRAIVDRANGNWYVIASSGTSPIPWGWHWEGEGSGHDLALGDYDGDRKTDRAIVDRANGNWFVIASTGTSPIPWGWHWEGESAVHVLALGDFDGDGATDRTIVQPKAADWYTISSSGNAAFPWGWEWAGAQEP